MFSQRYRWVSTLLSWFVLMLLVMSLSLRALGQTFKPPSDSGAPTTTGNGGR